MDAASLKEIFILVVCVSATAAWDTCVQENYDGTDTLLTCSDDCCGTDHFRYCCSSYSYSYTYEGLAAGVIAAIVCSVIGFILIIVGIVVCCVCCCRQSQGQRGHVVAGTQPHVAVIGQTAMTNPAFQPSYPGQPTAGAPYTAPYQPAYPTGVASPPPYAGGVQPANLPQGKV